MSNIDLKKLFDSKKYKRMNSYMKEIFVSSLFHTFNFNKIDVSDRVLLLDEMDSILSKIHKRDKFKIVVLNNTTDDELFDLATDLDHKCIYVRKIFLEQGIISINDTDQVVGLNYHLLECIYHEAYHIFSDSLIKKKKVEELPREVLEYYIFFSMIKTNIGDVENTFLNNDDFLSYTMIPDEYYANKYAMSKVLEMMKRCNRAYGQDDTFKEYYIESVASDLHAVNEYNKKNNTNYNIVDMYNIYLTKYLKDYAELYEVNYQELVDELNDTPRYLKK